MPRTQDPFPFDHLKCDGYLLERRYRSSNDLGRQLQRVAANSFPVVLYVKAHPSGSRIRSMHARFATIRDSPDYEEYGPPLLPIGKFLYLVHPEEA